MGYTTRVETVRNFRELGGLVGERGPVRSGVLFRSAHLGNASEADLAQITNDLGVRTIVDLRTDHDIASEGSDPPIDGVAHYHVPIFDDAGQGERLRAIVLGGDRGQLRRFVGGGMGLHMATVQSKEFVSNPSRMTEFGKAMRIIIHPDNWPLLWHCSAGKDRAGWVATAILLLLGADDETTVSHYLESNEAKSWMLETADTDFVELLKPFLVVHEDYVRAQIEYVRDTWGNGHGLFVDGFSIAPNEVDRFVEAIAG